MEYTQEPVDEPLIKSEPHTSGVDQVMKKTPPKNLPDAMIKGCLLYTSDAADE